MKKILVIGGSGYIGSRLVPYLADNYDVTSVDIGMFGIADYPTQVVDYNHLSETFLRQFTHIVLLAGHSCPSMCGDEMVSCWENNVSNFARLLQKLNPNTNLIYASTAAIYNDPYLLCAEEYDDLGECVDVYTLTKRTIEELARFRPNCVGLRFGTVGGFSENFRSENFPNAISTAATSGMIRISNPSLYRSVLCIRDLCRAVECIVERGIKSRIYNLSSFVDTILGTATTLQDIVKCDIIVNDAMKTGYSFHCCSDKFVRDYDFKFEGTIETIYHDIVKNYSKIRINVPREYVKYG